MGIVGGWLTFEGFSYGLRWLLGAVGAESFSPGVRQAILKVVLVACCLLFWKFALRRPMGEMGWRRPDRVAWWRWLVLYAVACLSMGGAAIGMILTGSHHPVIEGLSFPEIVVLVWFVSSVAEEIFVRGLVQSWMGEGVTTAGGRRAVVLSSAALFASLHLSLMWLGAGVLGGGIVVGATFGLGWAAASVRSSTNSLWHAIGVHVVGNIAAVPIGVVGMVLYRVINGHFPVR
ncbi:MAG: CPBP family intramembrane metalloprotease [Phycisphaeraceae bacterium]|nr:MAG: CPBP family intramembrane metalloprotease [Phycisphaeraceae bacterium]